MTTYGPQTTDPNAPPWARLGSHRAGALDTLAAAVDAHWPNRSHASDGFIGDMRHVAEGSGSDHNPWLNATVRAGDFTASGIDAGWFAEQLRILGAAGDDRLAGGGYVIWNERITTPDFTAWARYTGGDPHTSHVHVSLTRNPAGYEDRRPWTFLSTAAPQPPHPPIVATTPATPTTGHDATGHGDAFRADVGDSGPEVRQLQHELDRVFPAYSHLEQDGIYGPQTAAVVEDFDHRAAHDPALAAEQHALEGADGENVGPAGAHAMTHYGLRL